MTSVTCGLTAEDRDQLSNRILPLWRTVWKSRGQWYVFLRIHVLSQHCNIQFPTWHVTRFQPITFENFRSQYNNAHPWWCWNMSTWETNCHKISQKFWHRTTLERFPSVGRQQGHLACKTRFVGGDDLTGALHSLQLQLSSLTHQLHHP